MQAHERCRGPEDALAPPLDRAGFKELVREIDLWCSSCMVALEGRDPVAVLLGAKRADATLVHVVRVHPEHRRRGHARHLLTSLGQKLAILGPPRLVAEVPAERAPARALFEACQWRQEARLVDWHRPRRASSPPARAENGRGDGDLPVAAIGLAEAVGSGLLGGGARSWGRDLTALERRREDLVVLGFHSPERLEACLVALPGAARGARANDWEIPAAGATDGELGRLGLRLLLRELERRAGGAPLRLTRAGAGELDARWLVEVGFAAGAEHLLFASVAKAA